MYKYAFSALIASAVVLSSFVFATGCSDGDTGGLLVTEHASRADRCTNGQPDEGEMGIDCGGTCPGCGDGAPCLTDSDCANSACVAQAGAETGVCFGAALDGCFKTISSTCSDQSFSPYVCGADFPVSTLGDCSDVGVGSHGETIHCCKKPL